MIFTLDNELKISQLKVILKLLKKAGNKVVKISVNGTLYDISKIIDKQGFAIFELCELELAKKSQNDTVFEFAGDLKLSKFRKLINMIPGSGKIIKVSINGKCHDIFKVIDTQDIAIFEVK